MTTERPIHLQESIPRGQGEVVLPPVVIIHPTLVHIGAEGKTQAAASEYRLELGSDRCSVPSPLSGLAQRRPRQKSLDVNQPRLRLHLLPVIAVDVEPLRPRAPPKPAAGREGSRHHYHPSQLADGHHLKNRRQEVS